MKENKLFIGILLIVLVVLGVCVSFSFFNKEEKEDKTDAVLIKEEYESLNDKEGLVNVLLDEDNPFVYKSEDDVIKILREKSGIVLFASYKSNASRSIIRVLSDVAKEYKFGSISYLDIFDIRDSYSLDKVHKPIMDKDGTHNYFELLKILDEELVPYVLENSDGTKVNVGEKRIYLPTIVAVYNGSIQDVYSVSMDEDKIIKEDEIDKIKEIFGAMIKSITDETCDDAC